MSMLAEPRRKQKYSTDPRGLNWSNDDNKFGQKLLEKMGWHKGKGLGAHQNGRQEHITVAFKTDTRGVGCTKNNADNWIAHQDDFNSLLSELNKSQNKDTETQLQNLEEKSKQSRARVHYQKFVKGKDLSSAKQKDLASIFGRRSQQLSTVPNNKVENNQSDDAKSMEVEEEADTFYGIKTVHNGTSTTEYFARKMAEMKSRLASTTPVEPSGIHTESSHSEGVIKDDGIHSAKDEHRSLEKGDRKLGSGQLSLETNAGSNTDDCSEGEESLLLNGLAVTDGKNEANEVERSKSRKAKKHRRSNAVEESPNDDRSNLKIKKRKRKHLLRTVSPSGDTSEEPPDVKEPKRKKTRTSASEEINLSDEEEKEVCVDVSSDEDKKCKKRRKSKNKRNSGELLETSQVSLVEKDDTIHSTSLLIDDCSTTCDHSLDEKDKKHRKKTRKNDVCSEKTSDKTDGDVGLCTDEEMVVQSHRNSVQKEHKNNNDKMENIAKSSCTRDLNANCNDTIVEQEIQNTPDDNQRKCRKVKRRFSQILAGVFLGSNLQEIPGYGCDNTMIVES